MTKTSEKILGITERQTGQGNRYESPLNYSPSASQRDEDCDISKSEAES
jgi:hypothetical protein